MPEQGYEVEIEIQLRWRDMDSLGHVNNAVFLSYLEIARVAYFRAVYGEVGSLDFNFILARVEIDFLSPIEMSDRPICRVGIHEAGRKSFRFEYLLESGKDGRTLARASSVQVFYDYGKGVTVPMDEKMWEKVVGLRVAKGLEPPRRKE
jgi:acyl-CoA thioester hydrolase